MNSLFSKKYMTLWVDNTRKTGAWDFCVMEIFFLRMATNYPGSEGI